MNTVKASILTVCLALALAAVLSFAGDYLPPAESAYLGGPLGEIVLLAPSVAFFWLVVLTAPEAP